MEWTQVFVILGVFAAFFVYLLIRVDNLDKKMTSMVMDIRDRLTRIEAHLSHLEGRVSRIEDHMMPKVFAIPEEKPKKKAKGE